MSKFNFLLFLIVTSPIYSYAEEVKIESINSSEGAGIICTETMAGELTLHIFNELGKSSISINKRGNYLYLRETDIRYARPFYEDQDVFHILEKTRSVYFLDGKFFTGDINLDDTEEDKSNESYEILKSALLEAHQKGTCLEWRLD